MNESCFEELKGKLIGEYITFSIMDEKTVNVDIFSEKLCDYFEKLEPEIKLFRFERSKDGFENLTEEQKEEEKINILNGLNYAKKVLGTGECDLLILDEFLGVLDEGIVDEEDIISALNNKSLITNVILTGQNMSQGLFKIADSVLKLESEK